MRKTKPPYPAYVDRKGRAQTRPYAVHVANPAGSKLLRRIYKAKTGKRGTAQEATEHYATMQEPRWRAGENKTRIALTLLAEKLKAAA